MPSGRTNKFPSKWAWPRSRDPTLTIFMHTIDHISKTTSARHFQFGRRLCITNAEQAHK